MKELCFSGADILLPDFDQVDGTRWSCIACDQFTSEAAYWAQTERTVGDAPSALRIILPELYLGKEDEKRIEAIHAAMAAYKKDVLTLHKDAMIYLRRTCPSGAVREGLVGKIDLEEYDYNRGSTSAVRATEGTVLSRIPPRVAVRRGASIEAPHVMLLIDDGADTVFSVAREAEGAVAYDFPLMQGGGHVKGVFLPEAAQKDICAALSGLTGGREGALHFAVGDGNHSLASAKAYYEEIKATIGAEAAKEHPARYALCEVVNIHSEAIVFEPIYRVLFGADRADLLRAMRAFADAQTAGEAQTVTVVYEKGGICKEEFTFAHGYHTLTVGTLQAFLDGYLAAHPEIEIDYIHGEESLLALSAREGAVGFLFEGMKKSELFSAVEKDGALPRKTFSMGTAYEKRYYLECRSIL
ncbi:MAG: DUF1015 domain-containing protein [Clostridia bacterium]|nr:DUF1015 domain-containing protein [Clostridia bacterium]